MDSDFALPTGEDDMPPVVHPPPHWSPDDKQRIYVRQLSGERQRRWREWFARHLPGDDARAAPYGLRDIFGDEGEGDEPMLGDRADGRPLFYRGAYNILWGPPQSRKSWIAILLVKQVVGDWPRPQQCVYFDYEDNFRHFAERLRLIGCGPEQLRRPNSYSVDGKGMSWVLHRDSPGDLRPDLTESEFSMLNSLRGMDSPAVIVIDGVEAFCAAHGCDSNSNADWGELADTVLNPLSSTGAAVLLIDHVTKSGDVSPAYPIGASQKLARCRGAAYAVSSVSDSASKLVLRKDTNGQLGSPLGSTVAELALEGPGVYSPSLHLRVPEAAQRADSRIEPTMERVSKALEANDGLKTRDLRAAVGGRKETVDKAIEELERGGYIRRQAAGRAFHHHLINPYSRS